MTSKLDWMPVGPHYVASTRHRNKVGIAFWRIRKVVSGRWEVTDSTPWLLGDDGLERWPMFESPEAAKLWCEVADERLAGGVR